MTAINDRDLQIIKKILVYCEEVDMAISRFGSTYDKFR